MSRAKIADALRDVAFSGATERERSRLLLSELASIVRDGYRASSDDPHRHLREWWKAHSEDLVETDRMAATRRGIWNCVRNYRYQIASDGSYHPRPHKDNIHDHGADALRADEVAVRPAAYWDALSLRCKDANMTAVVTRGAYGPVYRVGIAGAKGYAEAQATFYPGRVGWRLNVYHFDDLHAFDALVETVKQLATQEKEIVLDWEHERLVKHEAPKSYRSDWE